MTEQERHQLNTLHILIADELILRNSIYLTHGTTHYLFKLSTERSELYRKQIDILKEETK